MLSLPFSVECCNQDTCSVNSTFLCNDALITPLTSQKKETPTTSYDSTPGNLLVNAEVLSVSSLADILYLPKKQSIMLIAGKTVLELQVESDYIEGLEDFCNIAPQINRQLLLQCLPMPSKYDTVLL